MQAVKRTLRSTYKQCLYQSLSLTKSPIMQTVRRQCARIEIVINTVLSINFPMIDTRYMKTDIWFMKLAAECYQFFDNIVINLSSQRLFTVNQASRGVRLMYPWCKVMKRTVPSPSLPTYFSLSLVISPSRLSLSTYYLRLYLSVFSDPF